MDQTNEESDNYPKLCIGFTMQYLCQSEEAVYKQISLKILYQDHISQYIELREIFDLLSTIFILYVMTFFFWLISVFFGSSNSLRYDNVNQLMGVDDETSIDENLDDVL